MPPASVTFSVLKGPRSDSSEGSVEDIWGGSALGRGTPYSGFWIKMRRMLSSPALGHMRGHSRGNAAEGRTLRNWGRYTFSSGGGPLRLGEDPELEAGAVGLPVGAAISKHVACRVEVARLIIGFRCRWSKTGSEGPRDVLDFADMHEGISEEGWRWRAAVYALNHLDVESFHPYIPEDVLTRARALHGAAIEYPPSDVVDAREADFEELTSVTSTPRQAGGKRAWISYPAQLCVTGGADSGPPRVVTLHLGPMSPLDGDSAASRPWSSCTHAQAFSGSGAGGSLQVEIHDIVARLQVKDRLWSNQRVAPDWRPMLAYTFFAHG
ncbi:hypothetical protein DFH08DRAFT_827559 [Mycena albidolilacea]|uniref:Uncharacterized protein n=1 Tax=Mycena albidolilacea TaxID=1033008 RepID=A0AAD6YYZ1_9AGAR|nr:hypothetical protein DFH08DRAFT_827559 [Mycena albidolilacea]